MASADTESFWFTTRSALFRQDAAGWAEAARYRPVLERYLASRYPRLGVHDREDVASAALLAIREQLAPRHDPSRGRFRQLLQVALRAKVVDVFRRRRLAPLPAEIPEPAAEDVAALDLEVSLLAAMEEVRDSLTQGPTADHEALYAFADRVVHGRRNTEIAAANGCGVDKVARLLRRVRSRLLHALLRRELEGFGEHELRRATALVREVRRHPGRRRELLDRLGDPRLRAGLEDFLARFDGACARFPALDSPAGEELLRGLRVLWGSPDEEAR